MSAIIGAPINSKTAYILDKFLKNQEEIQKHSATKVKTIFASEDITFAEKLKKFCKNTI